MKVPTLNTSTDVMEPSADQLGSLGLEVPEANEAPTPASGPGLDLDALAAEWAEENATEPEVSPSAAPLDLDALAADWQQEEREAEGNAVALRAGAAEGSTEEQATSLRLSDLLGMPLNIAFRQTAALKGLAERQAVASTVEASPGLGRYMQEAGRAALAKEDVKQLGMLERVMKGFPLTAAAGEVVDAWRKEHPFLASPLNLALSADDWADRHPFLGAPIKTLNNEVLHQTFVLGTYVLSREGTSRIPFLEQAMDEIDRTLQERQAAEDKALGGSLPAQVYLGTLRVAPFLVENYLSLLLGGAAGAALGAATGGVAGAPTGPGAAVTATGGAALGGTIGSYAGSGAFNYYQMVGPTYFRLSRLQDENGQRMNPALARVAAEGTAIIGGGLMSGLSGKLLAEAPFLKKYMQGTAERTASAALTKLSKLDIAKKAILGWTKHEAMGATTMAAINALNAGATVGASAASNLLGTTHLEVDPLLIPEQVADGFVPSLIDFAAISALGPGRALYGDVGRLRASRRSEMQVRQMGEVTASTKLAKLMPEELQKATGEMAAEAPESATFFVPVERFARYWQEKGVDPLEISKKLVGDEGKAYQEALSTGGDLPIPTERALSQLVSSGHFEGLRQDIRLNSDEFTPREAQREQRRLEKKLKGLLKPYQPGVSPAADLVYRDVLDRAMATKKVPQQVAERSARLAAQVWGNWGLELKTDAYELYRKLADLRIYGPKGETIDERAHLERQEERARNPVELTAEEIRIAEAEPERTGTRAPMLVQMKDVFERRTPEERERELFTDTITGLYNELGFEALPRPKDRPYIARFALEGGKSLNDFHGHDSYDGALRLMARTLEERGIPDAVKRSGDIEAWVKSPEHAKELAAELRKATGKKLNVFTEATEAKPIVGEGREAAGEAIAGTLKTLGENLKGTKDAAVAAGEAGHRLGVPLMVSKGLPLIDFEGKAKERLAEYDKKVKEANGDAKALEELGPRPDAKALEAEYGLPLDSKEAKDALKKAGTSKPMQDLVAHLLKQPKAAGPKLTEAHRALFTELEGKGATFDTIYRTKDGALTEKGFQLARKVSPGAWVISADARGIAKMNDAFGKEGTDRLIAEFTQMLVRHGGLAFDIAHPHGDEFLAQARNDVAAKGFFESVRKHTNRMVFYRILEDGRVTIQEGVHFEYGIGKTFKHADAVNLAERKSRQQGVTEPVTYDAAAGERRLEQLRDAGHYVRDVDARGEGAAAAEVPGGVQREAGGQGDQGLRPGNLGRGGGGDRQGHGEAPGAAGVGGVGGERRRRVAPPTQAELEEAYRRVDRMKSPRRRELALAWLDYTKGYESGVKRPQVKASEERMFRALQREFTKLGIVDPEHAFTQEPVSLPPQSAGTFRLEKGGERGFIEFSVSPEADKPRRFSIHLLETADASTLTHELFHFLTEAMGDVVKQEGATERMRKDYADLLKWMGHENQGQREAHRAEAVALASKPKEQRTPEEEARLKALKAKEERPAYAWEQYLMEGKAPSTELVGTFTRFSRWLSSIYGKVKELNRSFREKHGEEINLTDEVRGIFDRLLATQEEIQRARELDAEGSAPFRAALEGMTPEERATYQEATRREREQSEAELFRRLTEEDRKSQREMMRTERERIRAQVEQEVMAEPAQRAIHYFTKGEMPETPGSVPELLKDEHGRPYKLNRAELVELLGPDAVEGLPGSVFAKKRGGATAPAEVLAGLLEFDSAQAMVEAIRAAEPRREVIEAEVAARMRERFGPTLLDTPEALAEAAVEAAHNDKALQSRLLELRALRKQAFPDSSPKQPVLTAERARELAQVLILRKTVGELTAGEQGAAGYYLKAERESRKRALTAAEKGDFHKAYGEQETAVLNFALYREATALRDSLEKDLRKLKGSSKSPWRSFLHKANPAYQGAHDAILKAIGVGAEGSVEAGPAALDAFVTSAGGDALQVGFNVEAVKELLANPKPWKQLSVEEAANVLDAVANIRHAARAVNEILVLDKVMSREAWLAEVEEHLARRPPLDKSPMSRTAERLKEKGLHVLRGGDAELLDTETLAHMLDAGDRNGPAHRLFIDGRLKARAKEASLAKSVLEPIVKAWERMPRGIRKLRDKKVDVGELLPVPKGAEGRFKPVYTRDSLWMLFLNWGNESNRQRIRDGNGWTDANVEKSLSLLTKPELDFLQGVLDSIESLYPEIARVHEQRTGLQLGRVDSAPIRLNGEEYRGGYFPLRYDARISRQGERMEARDVADLFQANYIRPSTPASHRKARLQEVSAPVALEWNLVPAHFAQVIHDVAYGDWVRDAGSMALHPRFKELATEKLGPERVKTLVPWLRDVANARADSAAGALSDFTSRAAGWGRTALGTTAMSWNLPNQAMTLTDPWLARLDGVHVHNINKSYVKVAYAKLMDLRSWGRMPELQLSTEIPWREQKWMDNLRRTLNEAGPRKPGVMQRISEVGFHVYELLDRFHTRVVFKAAFDQAMNDGRTQQDAARWADDVVRRRFASFDIGERPPILRSKSGMASVLMFYTWANKNYNSFARLRDDGYLAWNKEGATAKDKAGVAVKTAATMIYFGLVGAGAAILGGRGYKKDEDKLTWLGERILLEQFQPLPLVGSGVEGLVTGQKISPRSSPEIAFVADALNRIGSLLRKASNGDASAEDAAVSMALLLVLLRRGPAGQVNRTVSGIEGLVSGDAAPRGPVEAIGHIPYGYRPNQGANPFTVAQDVIEKVGD